MDINQKLTEELEVKRWQVDAAVKLIDEGNTIPFISRYRKEVTGSLNDEQLRKLHERLVYLRNLEEKKEQFDPRAFLPPLMETVMHGAIPDEDVRAVCDCIERGVKEIVGVLIVEFGSAGRASAVKTKSLEEMAAFYRREGI